MNSSNPCAIDDEKLIGAVESKELLFNKSHHFYKNVIQKEVAWRAIAEECYVSGKSNTNTHAHNNSMYMLSYDIV